MSYMAERFEEEKAARERLQAVEHVWRANMQNAWSALQMIRETIETLGPPGILPSQEAVLMLHGPEPVHEATVIVEALQKMLHIHEQTGDKTNG